MTKRDDDALGETIASIDGTSDKKALASTVTPAQAVGLTETITPAQAIAISETITPDAALESGETLTPTQAIGISETIASSSALESSETLTPAEALASSSRDALESSETITPAEAASATHSVNRRARPGPEALPEIARSTYAVRRELARGGMGRILVADDSRLGRRVAIKELITNNRGLQRRFAREVRITARLQHPGIVPVYEAGHWPDGEPFYAMKLVAGQSLEKVVETKPELEDRLRLLPNLVGLTEAIAYAHGNSVIHRDLKPANVLVGDYGETVVIDWGLAKEVGDKDDGDGDSLAPVAAPGMTVHGAVVGTPAYMPPEQARGDRVDARADVYSLGALMWHVLAGRPPYKGSVESVLAQVRDEPPPRLRDVAPGVPEELASIVEHAMERDPDLRYPTARELAEELSRFQTGQLVTRHEYSAWQLFRRWVKRHRAIVAAVAALLVGGSTVGAIAFRQVMAERDRAREVSLGALEEQGRRELVEGHPLRASVFFSAAYRGGRSDEALRLMLGEAMRAVDASVATWPAGTWITHVAWAGKDQLIAVADDGAVTLWNISTATRDVIAPASARPIATAVSEDGKRLALLADTSLRIVDLGTRAVTNVKLPLLGAKAVTIVGDVVAVEGSMGVKQFGFDGTERPRAANAPPIAFPREDMWVGQDIAIKFPEVSDQEGAAPAHAFDMVAPSNGNVLGPIGRVGDRDNYSVGAIDHAGRRFAAGTEDGVVRIWDVSTGLPLASIDGHTRRVRSLAFDPTGTRLASTGDDAIVRVWSLDAPQFTLPVPTHSEPASQNGRLRAVAHFNEVVVGERVLRGLEELVAWVATSNDGATVVAGSRDGRLIRWDVATGRPLGTWELGAAVTAGDLARDGTIAVGTRDGGARIIHAGVDPIKLEGHATAIHALAWHPTRMELLSAADTAVRVWNAQGKLLRYLSAGEPIARAWWSPDGAWIIVDGESALQLWDGAHGTLLVRIDHGLSGIRTVNSGPQYGARDDAGVIERFGFGGFVPWQVPRETRPATAIAASVAERVPWLLTRGELVPAHALVAVRSEELQQTTTTYDFSGEVITATPSKPALPLSLDVAAVSNALRSLATGDSAGARTSLATVTDTQDPRTAYDVAWAWHFIGDEQAAYTMGLRAWTLWPDAATKPRVLADVFRFAAWGDVGHATVVAALGDAADNKARLALAETYDQLGHVALVTPTVESMTITDDWATRMRGLYLLTSRSYLRGDLMTAAEHLDVAARAIPADKLPVIPLGASCGEPIFRPAPLDPAADPALAIGTLVHSLAVDSFRVFKRTYDHRFALASRRLFGLLVDRFGADKDAVAGCTRELDALAANALARVGSFDKTIIRSEFDDQHTALVACYQRRVDSDASVEGKVVVSLEIASTGKITRVDTVAEPDTRAMQALATCVQTAISHFDLPRQSYAGRALVDYPLVFARPQ